MIILELMLMLIVFSMVILVVMSTVRELQLQHVVIASHAQTMVKCMCGCSCPDEIALVVQEYYISLCNQFSKFSSVYVKKALNLEANSLVNVAKVIGSKTWNRKQSQKWNQYLHEEKKKLTISNTFRIANRQWMNSSSIFTKLEVVMYTFIKLKKYIHDNFYHSDF